MIKEILREGFILKSKGYYKHAIETFYKALEIDNSSLELLLEIADLYYLIGDEERALNYIEQILESNPTHIDSMKLLMKIFVNKKSWMLAEQAAQNIYAISNGAKDLAIILELLNKQGKFAEVTKYNIPEKSSNILFEQAYAFFNLNQLSEAEKIINEALNLDKTAEKTLVLKAKILFKQDKLEESLELLGKLKINYFDDETLNFAGLVYLATGNFKIALEYFLKAIKVDSKNDLYYYNCASSYFKLGEKQLAKKYYNLAISLNPEKESYHLALANLYYSEKHYKRAMEELDSDLFEARLLKSAILYDTGYFALAKKGFDKLYKEKPEDFLVLEYLKKIDENLKIS